MIEAEALLKALESAADGLTLKQLTAQLPDEGGRKPKLRPALRELVANGAASFDGQRYRAAKHAKHVSAELSAVIAGADEKSSDQVTPKLEEENKAGSEKSAPAAKEHFSPAKAAVHAPHGHGRGHAAAKTKAAHVPAALAEGIRLRRNAQENATAAPDPRGAKNWGNSREKAEPVPRARSGELVGLLHLKSEGYGFVSPLLGASARDEDIFIPPGQTLTAIDGDIVRVRFSPGRDGRTIGEVTKIVEERRQLAIGAYHERGKDAFVDPHDRRMAGPIVVAKDPELSDGELVKVRIKRGAQGAGFPMRGELIGPLGARGEARFEILAAAYAQGFSDEFDAAVRTAAEDVPDHVRPEDHAGRRDLRAMPLLTIDGEDARDFDDAVYVERNGAGYRLVVAIADVASYVHEGGAIDQEALRRATSVYFPGTVLPMLPEQLSNGICSLNPDVERLCMVCDLQLDPRGAPTGAEIYPAVMKSHARLTYTVVAEVLEGKTPEDARVKARVEELKIAGELAKKMTALRFGRGALDFDLPESKIILDDKGEVIEISARPRNDAHRLVEEFMLAANEGVARFFSQNDLPTLYRVHDQPDQDKLEAFGTLAQANGFSLPSRLTPSALGDLLKKLEGAKAQRALTQLLLRAMMQAHYSPDDIGHYGLAAPTYLHFTSPIRRYPDLTVHRLLWKFWARDGKPQSRAERDEEDAQLAGVGAQCSERERAAMRAERDVVSFYSAQFMQQHVGEEFTATVTGVTDLGLFCQLDSPAVEGLIPAETLGHSVVLDTELQRLSTGSGQHWSLGDSIEIIVVSADPTKRRINFALKGGAPEGASDEGDENAEDRDQSGSARSRFKSENHGAPKRGGDSPAWSRAKSGGDDPREDVGASEPKRAAAPVSYPKKGGAGHAARRAASRETVSKSSGRNDERSGGSRGFDKVIGRAGFGKSHGKPVEQRGYRGKKPFARDQAQRGPAVFRKPEPGAFGRPPEKDNDRSPSPFAKRNARDNDRDSRGGGGFGKRDSRGGSDRDSRGGGHDRGAANFPKKGPSRPVAGAFGKRESQRRFARRARRHPPAARAGVSRQGRGSFRRLAEARRSRSGRKPERKAPIAAPPRGRHPLRGAPQNRHGRKPFPRR